MSQQERAAVTKEVEGNAEISPKFEPGSLGMCGIFERLPAGAATGTDGPAFRRARLSTGAQKGKSHRKLAMHHLTRRSAVQLVLLGAASSFAASMPCAATEVLPLAIKGYDPVAYFTSGKPTLGLPEIEYEWDEHRYRFSRAEHRVLFKADPVRYAPQFANFCAMSLARGEIVEADPERWLISEGKLYLFGKPNGPNLFQQALTDNVLKANENRPLIQKH
jgi:hypothetical protein